MSGTKPTRELLVSIHRKAANDDKLTKPVPFARFLPVVAHVKSGKSNSSSHPTPKSERRRNRELDRAWVCLHELQRRRVALDAELAEVQCREEQAEQATIEAILESSKPPSDETTDAPIAPTDDDQVNLARLNSLRHKICLNSAFRLSGISIYLNEQEELALRFDIQLHRTDTKRPKLAAYCYHCFFRIVVNQFGQYWMRLAQHTLPEALPVSAIVSQHFGGRPETFLGTVSDNGTILPFAEALDKLEAVAYQLYKASFSWCVRKDTFECLQNLTNHQRVAATPLLRPTALITLSTKRKQGSQPTTIDDDLDYLGSGNSCTPDPDPYYSVEHVEVAAIGSVASYKTIRFQLSLPQFIAHVTLSFPSDLCHCRAHHPMSAVVKLVHPGTPVKKDKRVRGRSLPSETEVNGEDENRRFTIAAEAAFLELPVEKALSLIAQKATTL